MRAPDVLIDGGQIGKHALDEALGIGAGGGFGGVDGPERVELAFIGLLAVHVAGRRGIGRRLRGLRGVFPWWCGSGEFGFTGESGTHFGEEIDHLHAHAGSFRAAIDGGAQAALLGLLRVIHEQHLMHDGRAMTHRHVLHGLRDAAANEIRMLRAAADDHARGR
jgi:hypothetical protein